MKMRPFSFYPWSKIIPVNHPKQLPSLSNNCPLDEEQNQKELEWKAMWQHLSDFMETEKKATRFPSNGDRAYISYLYFAALLGVALFAPTAMFTLPLISIFALPVPMVMVILKDVIYTNLMYSCSSNNSTTDSNRHHQSTVTTNRLLLQVANMPVLMTVVVTLGLWTIATSILYQINQHVLSSWVFVAFLVMPMVMVSLYVFYHVGGCRSVFLLCRSRLIYHSCRYADLLKKSCFEVKRYNNVSTYFTLHPRVNYDDYVINVDVYYKNTNIGHSQTMFSSGNGLPIMSFSSDLVVAKRRGTANDEFITMIDTSGEQQDPQIDHHHQYDDDNDGLAAPLLAKDSTI